MGLETSIKEQINIVRQLEQVFDLQGIMLKELKGKRSSSCYKDSYLLTPWSRVLLEKLTSKQRLYKEKITAEHFTIFIPISAQY